MRFYTCIYNPWVSLLSSNQFNLEIHLQFKNNAFIFEIHTKYIVLPSTSSRQTKVVEDCRWTYMISERNMFKRRKNKVRRNYSEIDSDCNIFPRTAIQYLPSTSRVCGWSAFFTSRRKISKINYDKLWYQQTGWL